MNRWGEASFEAHLPPETVLNQMEMAVIVCDRFSNVIYGNAFARQLFGFGGDEVIGHSILSLGIAEEDHEQATELARHVLKGGVWEGTFCNLRGDGTTVYTRAHAVPLRHPSGAVDGVVIFAREALRSNQRDQERYGLMERIGERLAGSLELESTLRSVADTLVPQFADHCFIDLFSGDRLMRRVSRHAGGWEPPPGTWAEVGEPVSYPSGHFSAKAMTRRDAVLVEDMVQYRYTAPSEPSRRLAEAMGITSAISAPLLVRGELLGVMSLALSNLSKRPDPHYDAFDRDLLGAIASRVALAVDNALLFEEERETALAFQKHLLPGDRPPRLDGLQIAWRYEPARPLEAHGHGIQTQVGGDWYDVIPLSAGRVGLVIGDVEGRGARAAAVMGQLRAALRAFAQDDKPPADILRKLDEWVRTMTRPERMRSGWNSDDLVRPPLVSCTYFVYDAWSRVLEFANAGHDPPLLIVDGQVGELSFESEGAMLGVRAPGMGGEILYNEETSELKPGSTLVLYTDGLIDRRPKGDGDDGEYYTREESRELVRSAVAEVARGGVEAIANAAYEAVPGDIDDDVAIVVIRTAGDELAVQERTFSAEPIMVSEARRMAADAFASWGMLDEQAELACLLVSEVVTNVVLHATATPQPRREMVVPVPAGQPGRGGEPLGAPPPVQFNAEQFNTEQFNTEQFNADQFDERFGRFGGDQFGPGAFDEDDWDLGADLGRREPPTKEFRLRLRRGADAIWVEVFDSDMRLPRIRSAGETDEGGRGLYLVDQLATRWGARPTASGKAVWFELPLTP
ncbi:MULTISPECIES: SpoIIE family protein phosphatase [Actinomadura]|uniref:SpoIIE family protein phosphatase n=1 Tax=Actinomadura litoris TaxID=2678616 RepID=A0A7K1L8E1_9ACTN|nr:MULTISPECIES: SpoIIE family protein phosphatase [Actinomadura]MBT2213056.1 SpoIIE family protein phosphatase [Actinomadura sp. NEAU-AAG7]MUN40711.1 SpoIIE family protein phosphatase [Actinomadura litoris]